MSFTTFLLCNKYKYLNTVSLSNVYRIPRVILKLIYEYYGELFFCDLTGREITTGILTPYHIYDISTLKTIEKYYVDPIENKFCYPYHCQKINRNNIGNILPFPEIDHVKLLLSKKYREIVEGNRGKIFRNNITKYFNDNLSIANNLHYIGLEITTNVNHSKYSNVYFNGAIFKTCTFTNCQFINCSFVNCVFVSVIFINCLFNGAHCYFANSTNKQIKQIDVIDKQIDVIDEHIINSQIGLNDKSISFINCAVALLSEIIAFTKEDIIIALYNRNLTIPYTVEVQYYNLYISFNPPCIGKSFLRIKKKYVKKIPVIITDIKISFHPLMYIRDVIPKYTGYKDIQYGRHKIWNFDRFINYYINGDCTFYMI